MEAFRNGGQYIIAPETTCRCAMKPIHLYDCCFDRIRPLLALGSEALPADERERAARFKVDAAREEYLLARLALRRILARHLGSAPGPFAYGKAGKPSLPGHGLEFNLSHSRGRLIIAVSTGQAVGVDIEQIQPGIDPIPLAQAGLPAADVDSLLATPAGKRVDCFYRLWTEREACLKALGCGLGRPPAIVSRHPLGADTFRLALADGGGPVVVRRLPAAGGFQAAIAVTGCPAMPEIIREDAIRAGLTPT